MCVFACVRALVCVKHANKYNTLPCLTYLTIYIYIIIYIYIYI